MPMVVAFLLPSLLMATLLSLNGCEGGRDVIDVPHEPPGAGSEEPFPKIANDEPSIVTRIPKDAACPLALDIHVPPAQDPAIPLIPEAQEATVGAITLRNNDIDVPQNDIAGRITHRGDLMRVEGIPDSAVAPIANEDDLIRIDLSKAIGVGPVFLNAYAMALESGDTVPRQTGLRPPLMDDKALHLWKQRNKAGPIALPYQLTKQQESLYIEGHKAGRYRLVLFHYPDGNAQKARRVKAAEQGDPHATPARPEVTFEPVLDCYRNVRATVAVCDIFQKRRHHVFDVLWGGRALIEARMWPPNGDYTWDQLNANATWINGNLRGKDVKQRGTVAHNDMTRFVTIGGGFVPDVVPVNQLVRGTGLYDARLRLTYVVENVTFRRDEPLTVMAPHRLDIMPRGFALNEIVRGTDVAFSFQADYDIYEQNGRLLKGPDAAEFTRQYGARLRMYEALGQRHNSQLRGEDLIWVSPAPTEWDSIRLDTKPRIRAVPLGTSKTTREGRFRDNFGFNLTPEIRNYFDGEIQTGRMAPNTLIFSAQQDIVALLNNDTSEYDVRLARDNVLEVIAPNLMPGNRRGPLGFRMRLGGAGGVNLNTGAPDLVPSDHHPSPLPP